METGNLPSRMDLCADCSKNLTTKAYKFCQFSEGIDFDEVEGLLYLAETMLLGIHGFSRVQLETRVIKDPQAGVLVIDASTALGEDLVRGFFALMTSTFDASEFKVEKLPRFGGAN